MNLLKKTAIDGASKVEEGNRSAAIDKIKSISNKVASFYSFSTSVYIKSIKAAKSDARAICRKIVTAKPNPKIQMNLHSIIMTSMHTSISKI